MDPVMSAKEKLFQSDRKKTFLANDSNDSVYKNINLNRHRHHHRHSSDNDFVRSKSISNKTYDKGYNSFDAQPSSSSPIWKKNGNSNLSEYLNVWDSAKNEKEKKKSSEGVLSKTTLNLSREIEIYEQSVEDAENDSGVGKKVEEKALPPVEEPEIFPRQFENGVPETQIQQFTGSAKLFNPYTFGGPDFCAPVKLPEKAVDISEKIDSSSEDSDGFEVYALPTVKELQARDENEFNFLKHYNAVILDETEIPSSPDVSPTVDSSPTCSEKIDNQFNLEEYVKFCSAVVDADASEICRRYSNFLKHKPESLIAVDLGNLLGTQCCAKSCFSKFNGDCIMRLRMCLPTTHAAKDSTHYAVLQYQYFLLKNCFIDGEFVFEIRQTIVCRDFFCAVYIINETRFQRLYGQLAKGFKQAIPHGNTGRSFEHESTVNHLAKLANVLNTLAEPHPSGTGLLMPSRCTRIDIAKLAGIYKKGSTNTTQLFNKIVPTLHWQKANTFTKCEICISLKLLIQSDELSPEMRAQAEAHYENHLCNIWKGRRCYASRKEVSFHSNELLSVAHDGMSNDKNKVPSLLDNRGKKLTDTLKFVCGLNVALVHKKSGETEGQIHCYWNPDQCFAANANATASQLFYTISQCDVIPSQIAIQLDNCAVNRNYTVFGAFGLLLKWVPAITKVYICTDEVGHTHNDVDQKFGVLAKILQRTEIYSPQGYLKLAEENLHGVRSNVLIPAVYDFESIVSPINDPHGKIKANHFFELSRNADEKVIVKIARFTRSKEFLTNDSESDDSSAFLIFKEDPDLEKFPAVIPPKKLDREKYANLLKCVKGTIPVDGYKELAAFPNLYDSQPPAEEFNLLLDRIRSKAVRIPEKPQISDDPDNEKMNAFLKSSEVQKIWESSEFSISADSTKKATPKPRKRKAATTVNEIKENPQSSTVTPKLPAPRKIIKASKKGPKSPATTTVDATKAAEETPKRGRGRPRKV